MMGMGLFTSPSLTSCRQLHGRRSYLARYLGWSGAYRSERHQQRLAIAIGVLVIGIVLALWFAKATIGSGLRYGVRFQMALLAGHTVAVIGSGMRSNESCHRIMPIFDCR